MANVEHLKILKEGRDVWNTWRKENSSIVPDLSGANLFEEDLEEFDLSSANLSNANLIHAWLYNGLLQCANLSNAVMRFATLFNADISGALLLGCDLSYANFSEVDLSNADLSSAELFYSRLLKVNLSNANLEKCSLGPTVFGLTNFSTCRGLETVIVGDQCSIDFQTLQASKNLPKSFLLKIGLPELYIDYLPDFFQPEGIRYYPVFLSHSWANKPFASKLYEALIAKGVNVFFDEKNLKPGDDIFTSLSRGIELYDKTILVCSEDSLNSWWVDQELELVFEKERNLQKETGEKTGLLIPIRIDDHIDTWPSGKRMAIKQRIIGDFRNWQNDAAFEKALDDLIHALNADRPEIKPPSFLKKK